MPRLVAVWAEQNISVKGTVVTHPEHCAAQEYYDRSHGTRMPS